MMNQLTTNEQTFLKDLCKLFCSDYLYEPKFFSVGALHQITERYVKSLEIEASRMSAMSWQFAVNLFVGLNRHQFLTCDAKTRLPSAETLNRTVEYDLSIISLRQCNQTMKKTVPLLLAKMFYQERRDNVEAPPKNTLHFIIDEAHNFFIHRLVNDKDLFLIDNTISTLDRMSKGLIPNLSKGACIVTGTAFHLPLVMQVDYIENKEHHPASDDVNLFELWEIDT